MNKKTVRTCLAAILAASMLGGVASASADGTEDQAAAQKVADMIDAITNGRQPLVNGEAGKRALELILAIYQSAAQRLPVKLPLLSGRTLDFKGQFENE